MVGKKLFSERLYYSYSRNYNIPVRVVEYHNIYGSPEGVHGKAVEKKILRNL